jgi:Family of unknown function (DUF6221)
VSDLVAFLRARLDETERNAQDALALWPETHFTIDPGSLVLIAFHRTHDPARVLREVQAKRAIFDLHSPSYPNTYPEPSGQPTCGVCHAGGWDWDPERWPCPTVRALAAVYRDHPDYDEAWKP